VLYLRSKNSSLVYKHLSRNYFACKQFISVVFSESWVLINTPSLSLFGAFAKLPKMAVKFVVSFRPLPLDEFSRNYTVEVILKSDEKIHV